MNWLKDILKEVFQYTFEGMPFEIVLLDIMAEV